VDWRVGGVERDGDATVGCANLAWQLGKAPEQVTDVVRVRVVPFETLEEPFLSVVSGDLDAIDDCLVLAAYDLAPRSRLGDGDLLRERLVSDLKPADVRLEGS